MSSEMKFYKDNELHDYFVVTGYVTGYEDTLFGPIVRGFRIGGNGEKPFRYSTPVSALAIFYTEITEVPDELFALCVEVQILLDLKDHLTEFINLLPKNENENEKTT